MRKSGWCGFAAVLAFMACTPRAPEPPLAPSNPSPEPTPNPAVAFAQEVSTVSGTAYEHTGGGMHPLPGLALQVHGRIDGDWRTVDVLTDAAGRYEVAGITREFVSVVVRKQRTYVSPCSVMLWLWRPEALDVHVASVATLQATGLPRSMPPFVKPTGYQFADVLWGHVTENTPQGTRPVVGTSAEHFFLREPDPTGFTETDRDGEYILCGYESEYGQEVRVSKPAYRTSVKRFQYVWRIDFDLVRE